MRQRTPLYPADHVIPTECARHPPQSCNVAFKNFELCQGTVVFELRYIISIYEALILDNKEMPTLVQRISQFLPII